MHEAQCQGLSYDPFLENVDQEALNKNQENLQKITSFGVAMKDGYQKNEGFFQKFATTYGIDYCPVYSVVGSIISQEIIKIAESKY